MSLANLTSPDAVISALNEFGSRLRETP
ncbi:uncharacterized protein METZ01_LOCUS244023, partial [marine metagenome]